MEQAHGSCLALQQDWPFIALTVWEYSKEIGGRQGPGVFFLGFSNSVSLVSEAWAAGSMQKA